MFKERRLISETSKVINPLSSPQERTETLNDPQTSNEFNEARIRAASEEMQRPIRGVIDTTRKALGAVLLDLPKAIIKKTLGFTTDVATNTIAIPANIGRWALDLLRVPPRALIAGADYLSEQTFGRISRIMKGVNTKVHNTLGTTPAFSSG